MGNNEENTTIATELETAVVFWSETCLAPFDAA